MSTGYADLAQILNSYFVQSILKPFVITIGCYFTGKACVIIGSWLRAGYNENVKHLWQPYDLVTKYGEYVVITNSGDLLGFEFAKAFAKRGHSLVLVRQQNDQEFDKKQEKIQSFIHHEKGRELRVITQNTDQSDLSIYETIENELRKEEIKGKIGILLNNAGLADKRNDNFLTVTPRFVLKAVHRSVIDFLMVTKSVLKIMAENKRGLIVNVTSPNDYTSYSEGGFPVSMKVFTEEFNRVIRRELKKSLLRVKVEAIHPGRICDPGHKNSSNALIPTPHEFVKSAIKVIGKVDSTTGYWYHSVNNFLHSFVPNFIAELLDEIKRKMDEKCKISMKSGYEVIRGMNQDVELGN